MVSDVSLNLWAVLAAAAANMVLGSLWYGPFFGKAWMKGMGWDPNMKPTPEMKKAMGKSMGVMALTSLLMAYVLAYFVQYSAAITWMDGAQTGFWAWAGFQLTFIIQTVIFERKNKTVATINAAYQLVALMGMGAILAVWA